MADDRMRNDDDLQRNMGGGAKDQDYGQQSPGRTGQEGHGKQGGQHAGGSQQKSNYGSGQNESELEDDDLGAGNAQGGGMGRGGQNR